MGPDQIFFTQVGLFFEAWVSSGQLPLCLENFPLKIPNFSNFTFGSKKFQRVGSKNVRVKQTVIQKYPQVGSGQSPSLK